MEGFKFYFQFNFDDILVLVQFLFHYDESWTLEESECVGWSQNQNVSDQRSANTG